MMDKLFNIEETPIKARSEKCKTCIYSERWECSSKLFWYCTARKSKRTDNGLLKIKANQSACDNYKTELTKI